MERSLQRVLRHDSETDPDVVRAMDALILRYPEDLRADLRQDAPRMIEHATWVRESRSVLDLGGGFTPFAPRSACWARGPPSSTPSTTSSSNAPI